VIVGGAVFASVAQTQGSTLDGVWWAMTTVTTVGYGDIYPESTSGRIIGITIMLVGIGFVALLTAFIADRFINVSEESEAKEDLILAELRVINARLDALEPGPPRERRAPTSRHPHLTSARHAGDCHRNLLNLVVNRISVRG
jgi:voltage-gated potassium channel